MDLGTWIDRRGGIAHARDALRGGHTRYAIRASIDAGRVRRIRRDWLATTNAPPVLLRAADAGGRVACVSAAMHHRLWTIDDGRFHLAVPPSSGHSRPGDARVHWSLGPVPVGRFALVEPIANALWHVADCQPFENALATWESALRGGHVSSQMLDGLPMRSEAGQRVRAAAGQLSDSGIESIPVTRLARIGITVRQQVVIDGHPVDGLIGERLVLQIDGYEFHRTAEQRRRDIAADRRLRLMGYTVLRIDYHEVLFGWDAIELEICMAVAQGLHLGSGGERRLGRMPGSAKVLPTS